MVGGLCLVCVPVLRPVGLGPKYAKSKDCPPLRRVSVVCILLVLLTGTSLSSPLLRPSQQDTTPPSYPFETDSTSKPSNDWLPAFGSQHFDFLNSFSRYYFVLFCGPPVSVFGRRSPTQGQGGTGKQGSQKENKEGREGNWEGIGGEQWQARDGIRRSEAWMMGGREDGERWEMETRNMGVPHPNGASLFGRRYEH